MIYGFIAGLLCALGGAWKDTPYEGFKPITFLRSIWVGTAWGIIVSHFTQSWFLAIPCCGWLERCTVEGYKIIRGTMPGKFLFLPDVDRRKGKK